MVNTTLLVWEIDRGVIRKAKADDLRETLYMLLNLIDIGCVTTYNDLAKLLNTHPRVIGYLLKSNDKPIVIPCHRVIRSNGGIGGYRFGGKYVKKRLLAIEGVKIANGKVDRRCIVSIYNMLLK